jgi:hypothetical protein
MRYEGVKQVKEAAAAAAVLMPSPASLLTAQYVCWQPHVVSSTGRFC